MISTPKSRPGPAPHVQQLELTVDRHSITNISTTARKYLEARNAKAIVLQADDDNTANLVFDVSEAMDRGLVLGPADVHAIEAPVSSNPGREYVLNLEVWLKTESGSGAAIVWVYGPR